MGLSEQDKARVAEIEAQYNDVRAFDDHPCWWERQHHEKRLGEGYIEKVGFLLSLIRRLSEQPEVARCEYCDTTGKFLAVIDATDPRILISVSGSYLQVFDEEYPGFVDNTKIHNCPMCGRAPDGQRAGEG